MIERRRVYHVFDGGGNRGDVLLAAFVSESLPSSFFADAPKFRHVLRDKETTSRGLSGLVCLSRTSERGEKGDCVEEGGGEEGSARGSVHFAGGATTPPAPSRSHGDSPG